MWWVSLCLGLARHIEPQKLKMKTQNINNDSWVVGTAAAWCRGRERDFASLYLFLCFSTSICLGIPIQTQLQPITASMMIFFSFVLPHILHSSTRLVPLSSTILFPLGRLPNDSQFSSTLEQLLRVWVQHVSVLSYMYLCSCMRAWESLSSFGGVSGWEGEGEGERSKSCACLLLG